MTLYKNTLVSSIIHKYAGTISLDSISSYLFVVLKMHGSIYILYLHVKIIALQTFKNHANVSYRVIYSNFLKALRCFYLGSNKIVNKRTI